MNLTHEDHVEPGAAELTVLAANAQTPLQALAVDEPRSCRKRHADTQWRRVASDAAGRGVQFHPEITGSIIRGYIAARRPVLVGLDPDALMARAADCPDSLAVIANFRRAFVARA